MAHGSYKAVLTAILANSLLTVLKFAAAFLTHSASMMNEAIHSMMDTFNQVFLWIGLVSASKPADRTHAFGHAQKKYLWNLWSAIGLFSMGAGIGLTHAWHSYHKAGEIELPHTVTFLGVTTSPLQISMIVLGLAFLLEGYSLLVALKEFLTRMKKGGFG